MTRVAVVGHVEWVDFLRIDHLPLRGEVRHAERDSTHAGGGAVVAATVLAQLGAEVDFFCAVGSDAHGDAAVAEMRGRGVTVHAARRPGRTRDVFTFLERSGERTIVAVGPRMQPEGADDLDWDRLRHADGVYFTAGDVAAVKRARAARVLVATPRIRERLDAEGVDLDALIFSVTDQDEVRWAEPLEARTRMMVATEGAAGGRWWGSSEGHWDAVPPPGAIRDSYGAGDSFAAGFTFGLAAGRGPKEAAAIGARCGAEMLTRVGAP